ncbi:MAG: hypothetical protein V7L25_30855 [Nostoc sp.]|uniref:hypothetical protein n=1 Tax=Nostoc sp. TaxID=1180 RepID=UPI002FF11AA1
MVFSQWLIQIPHSSFPVGDWKCHPKGSASAHTSINSTVFRLYKPAIGVESAIPAEPLIGAERSLPAGGYAIALFGAASSPDSIS